MNVHLWPTANIKLIASPIPLTTELYQIIEFRYPLYCKLNPSFNYWAYKKNKENSYET